MSKYRLRAGVSVEGLNALAVGHLPGLVGIEILVIEAGKLRAILTIRPEMLAR